MTSRGGAGRHGSSRSGGSGGSRGGRGMIISSPHSTDRQPTPSDCDDQGTPRVSAQASQTSSTGPASMIYVYHMGDGGWDFSDSGTTSRVMTDLLKSRITSFWPCFTEVPVSVKDMWFEEFKSMFTWVTKTSFGKVRKLWDTKCATKYRQIVSEMKRNKKRPGCITEEVWQQFLQYWGRDDVKVLAKRNSDNRNKNPRPHIGGSRPAAQYRNDLEEKYGRPPTYMEVYIRMHRIDPADGSAGRWVDSWSSDFVERYDTRVAELQSEGHDISHEELDRLFVQLTEQGETTTCKRSTRRPGFGNAPSIYKDNTYSSRSQASDETERLQERVQELETTNDELKGQLQDIRDEMRDFVREMRQERANGTEPSSSQPAM